MKKCLVHKLAESIWPCKLDQINEDPQANWYRLQYKKTVQQTVCGSQRQNMT